MRKYIHIITVVNLVDDTVIRCVVRRHAGVAAGCFTAAVDYAISECHGQHALTKRKITAIREARRIFKDAYPRGDDYAIQVGNRRLITYKRVVCNIVKSKGIAYDPA